MRLSIVFSRATCGISSPLVSVEVHISPGLPSLSIVGLPEAAVKESKDRVRSAILNSNFNFPTKKIIINLAPADLPKEGGRFDLPIAIGILAASNQIPIEDLHKYEFAGELALSGKLRSFNGALPFAIATRKDKRELILPYENANEAAMSGDNIIYPAKSLVEVCNHLTKKQLLVKYEHNYEVKSNEYLDLADIQGQPHAKRALEIAAAGKHSLLLVGPPGTGKTMLASRLPGIMPALSIDEALEVAIIYSIYHHKMPNWCERPFRQPHHTASSVAMVGGGSHPKPGEISLAHNGVLFLDELPEFDRKVLEVLREPLEAGCVVISRANQKIKFPAKFQLIAAMNPCPCGQLGNANGKCKCHPKQVLKYNAKISGPFLDRIDLNIQVPMLPSHILTEHGAISLERSATVRNRIEQAYEIQRQRQKIANSQLNNEQVKKICYLNQNNRQIMQKFIDKLKLSARGYYRILRVARTIADLNNSNDIQLEHLHEALSFRKRDIISTL